MKYYFLVIALYLFYSCGSNKTVEYNTDCENIEVESDLVYILEMNSPYFIANDIELVKLNNRIDSCIIILRDGSREFRIKKIPTDIELLGILKEFYGKKM